MSIPERIIIKIPGEQGPTGGTLPASTDGTFAANSDSLMPTQKAVKTYVDGRFDAVDAEVYKGALDCSTNPNYPAANAGHIYRVSVAGKIGGASGVNVEAGDRLECHVDGSASGNHATVGGNWWIQQANVDSPATTNSAQTFTNKGLQDSTTDIVGNGDATKKAGFNNDLVTAGQRRVLTVPNKNGVLLTDPTAATDILPTLDLDLTSISGAPFAGNHTRATAGGYRQNSKGVYVPTVVNEPVIDFSAGTALGTGFYGAFTNLLLRSEEFDNAAHTKSNVTVTANSTVGPDGATTMDTLDATVGGGFVTQAAAMTPSSVTIHTASAFLKQGTGATTRVSLDFKTGGTLNSCQAVITWATKAVVLSGAANDKSYQLEDVGGGIYKLSTTGSNSGGANTAVSLAVYPADVATGTVYAWGAQLTATAFPVPYVPTTSATVVRNADNMVIAGTDFTDFYNPVEGTIYAEVTTPSSGVGFPAIFQVDDGSSNNRHVCYYSSGNLSYFVAAGGVSVASPTRAVAGGTKIKVAVFFSVNNFNIYVDGVGGTLDSSGALPTGLNRIKVGAGDGAWNGHIRRLIYFPKALDATTLQRMTA